MSQCRQFLNALCCSVICTYLYEDRVDSIDTLYSMCLTPLTWQFSVYHKIQLTVCHDDLGARAVKKLFQLFGQPDCRRLLVQSKHPEKYFFSHEGVLPVTASIGPIPEVTVKVPNIRRNLHLGRGLKATDGSRVFFAASKVDEDVNKPGKKGCGTRINQPPGGKTSTSLW